MTISKYRTVPPLDTATQALVDSAQGTTVITQYQKSQVYNLTDQVANGVTSLVTPVDKELPYAQLVHNGLTLSEGADADYVWADDTTINLNFTLTDTDVVLFIQ